MQRIYLRSILLIGSLIFSPSIAQHHYWVIFTDKDNVAFNPYTYFDARTIQKRINRGIPIVEFTDFPVRVDYIENIKSITGEIHTVSRWVNGVSVSAGKKKLDQIARLAYVEKIIPIEMYSTSAGIPFKSIISRCDEDLRKRQFESMGGVFFENLAIDGKGVRIAVFDNGFSDVDKSPVFEHLRNENRIIATWDFVKNREFVYSYRFHGTSVLTCIAGKLDDKKFGLATGAEFLLARTEISREVFSEEENWLAAMEWADKNGADIINSSLGYTHHRYRQKQMDGKSTLVSRAASMAAAKGILVVNAAGNDGSDFWRVIAAPADADSILSVGGINPETGHISSFSSLGPTFDGRMKPNVCAFGTVVTSNALEIKSSSGTSFAAPLVAGFAACVMQMNPEWSNIKTLEEIQKSGHLYPYFDYAHGFGIPQAAYFTGEKNQVKPTFSFLAGNDSVRIVFTAKSEEGVMDEIEMHKEDEVEISEGINAKMNIQLKTDRYTMDDDFLYFNISGENEKDILKRYAVVKIRKNTNYFSIPLNEIGNASLRVFYKGYFSNFQVD